MDRAGGTEYIESTYTKKVYQTSANRPHAKTPSFIMNKFEYIRG